MSKKKRYKNISKARAFLKAVKEALEVAEDIEATVNDYRKPEGQTYADLPPLLKEGAEWDVPKKDIEGFRSLVNFMRRALFGVDCDSDNAVFFSICDRTREENFLPQFVVPRVRWEDPLEKRFEQLDLAKSVVSCLQSRVDQMQDTVDRELKELVAKDARIRKAKHCEICGGKGWVDTDPETWLTLDYGEKCHTRTIGCNPQLDEKRMGAKYRLFCECQKEDE